MYYYDSCPECPGTLQLWKDYHGDKYYYAVCTSCGFMRNNILFDGEKWYEDPEQPNQAGTQIKYKLEENNSGEQP